MLTSALYRTRVTHLRRDPVHHYFEHRGYSWYVDIDRLCISGQCGFASTVEGNALTIDEERAKLDLLVETASEIWG